jgi:hypothetical protein
MARRAGVAVWTGAPQTPILQARFERRRLRPAHSPLQEDPE